MPLRFLNGHGEGLPCDVCPQGSDTNVARCRLPGRVDKISLTGHSSKRHLHNGCGKKAKRRRTEARVRPTGSASDQSLPEGKIIVNGGQN